MNSRVEHLAIGAASVLVGWLLLAAMVANPVHDIFWYSLGNGSAS